jgi:acyl carrier protein
VDDLELMVLDQLEEKFGERPQLSDSLAVLGVDSVGMAELTVEIEKKFAIRVDDGVLSVDTVQNLVDYIRARQSVAP